MYALGLVIGVIGDDLNVQNKITFLCRLRFSGSTIDWNRGFPITLWLDPWVQVPQLEQASGIWIWSYLTQFLDSDAHIRASFFL